MEKIKVFFNENESEATETLKIGNKPIEVRTYISLPVQGILVQQYCEELIDVARPIEMRVLNAKIKLYISLINFMTNLEIEDIDDYIFPLDDIIASGAYEKILEKITNYKEFENTLNKSVELIFKEKYSKSDMAFRLEGIIDKVEEILSKIVDIDLDKDGIAELLQTVLKTQKEFNDKYQIVEPSQDITPIIEDMASKDVKKTSASKKKS